MYTTTDGFFQLREGNLIFQFVLLLENWSDNFEQCVLRVIVEWVRAD
jgi:hypothetical protein